MRFFEAYEKSTKVLTKLRTLLGVIGTKINGCHLVFSMGYRTRLIDPLFFCYSSMAKGSSIAHTSGPNLTLAFTIS
jgi:hypothetical protein